MLSDKNTLGCRTLRTLYNILNFLRSVLVIVELLGGLLIIWLPQTPLLMSFILIILSQKLSNLFDFSIGNSYSLGISFNNILLYLFLYKSFIFCNCITSKVVWSVDLCSNRGNTKFRISPSVDYIYFRGGLAFLSISIGIIIFFVL